MRRFLIGLFLFGILSSFIFAQIKNDYEAKAFFAKNGISPLQVIQNSEFIIIKNGQIKSSGGNPILASIQPTNIVYLPGASGYVTRIRTVFIEGDNFMIRLCGVVIGNAYQKGFIVGKSLTDIANYLVRK
jgi:hypothetical protein